MRVRFLVLMVSLFLTGIFAAGNSFAHPPNLHKDKAPRQTQTEQTQTVDKTTSHEHEENVMGDHQDDGANEVDEHSHEEGDHDAQEEQGGHSHWGISPDSSPFSKKMAALGNFHPLIVHFPIALFLTAAFAQALNLRTKDGRYDTTVSLLVWCGAIGALVAGLLGWAHSGPIQVGENSVMMSHRWIGTLLLLSGLVMALVMTKANSKPGGIRRNLLFNIFLFGFALTVAIQGFLGGALAHGGMKHLMPGMM